MEVKRTYLRGRGRCKSQAQNHAEWWYEYWHTLVQALGLRVARKEWSFGEAMEGNSRSCYHFEFGLME